MKSIEIIAKDFLGAYSNNDKDAIAKTAKRFIREINKDEWQFSNLDHNYAVAKSLYYMLLQEECELSDPEYASIVRLTYYCLLKNYITNANVDIDNPKYLDVIGGSELIFIIICENHEFMMFSIFSGMLNIMPNYAQKYLRNQLLLFGGLVKEYRMNHGQYSIDSYLSNRFDMITSDLYNALPINDNLRVLKGKSLPDLQMVVKELEFNLKFGED